MKSDKTKQTRADLLRDLENLRAQLVESTELSQDNIPLLIDRVEKAMSEVSDQATRQRKSVKPEKKATGHSETTEKLPPDQPSLFENTTKAQEDVSLTPLTRPTARGDNPFLPKHIRDRLEERRQTLANDLAQASAFASASPQRPHTPAHQKKSSPMTDDQTLVEELLAEYLPRIEAELRRRLIRQLKDNDNVRGSNPSEADKSP